MRLQVELYGTPVGELEGEPRTFDFTPSTEAIEKFGDDGSVFSVAVPLTRRQRRDRAPRRRIWFEELLPEGDQYDHMLARAGLRRGDTLRFLARYGRDVAGALQVWDLDDPSEPRVPSAQPVSDADTPVARRPDRRPARQCPFDGSHLARWRAAEDRPCPHI